jgi:signal transduction histidine kinase
MRLRTKLLGGILVTLLAQIAVTGTFTLTSFVSTTRASREAELRSGWTRARAYVEELKHRLYTDLFQLSFLLRQDAASADPDRARQLVRSSISLTSADRIVLVDDPGGVVVDEKAGVSGAGIDLPVARLAASDFRFPRNQFVSVKYGNGTTRLFLVTGTTIPLGEGTRGLYLVTDIDTGVAEAIFEKTGTEVAFLVGSTPVAAASSWQSFDTVLPAVPRIVRLGDAPYSVLSQPLSSGRGGTVNLAAVRSLLADRIYVRSVLLSYLTAFLVTLAASLFVAAGITSLAISPFSRLSAWLHRYMDTGEVGSLQIRSRDDIGFLAGAFHGMVSTLIHEKKVIGEQLEQIGFLHAYNERIVDSIRAGIVVIDQTGDIEFCNGYFAQLTGRGADSLRGVSLAALMENAFTLQGGPPGDALTVDRDAVVEGLALARPGDSPLHFTAKVSTIALPGSRRGSLVVLEDVSASERLWERMMIADRITSLGLLSAGMAHEINNPLGSIQSHVSWLKAVEKDKEKLDSLAWIDSETSRIASLIRRVRAYAAAGPGAEGSADLNTVVHETTEILRFAREKKGIALSLDLAEALPPVSCAADELKQVLVNLLLNAIDACSAGGTIGISTVAAGGSAVLRVVDDGAGIAPADLKRIFDPFFTTKAANGGSGLGLSISFAILKRAGGDIRVAGREGGGTEVEVMLRVHERADR